MEARASMQPSRPQSVAELVAQGENFSFNTNIPLKHWTRAAETLFREAEFALSDGDYGRAYMMLYRHSVLVLNCLPKHPQYKDPEIRQTCRFLEKRVDRILKDMERLKPILEDAVKEWERMKPTTNQRPSGTDNSPSTYAEYAARDPSLCGNATILDASQNQDLAVDLAQKELTRRDNARRASKRNAPASDAELRKHMEAARATLDSSSRRREPDAGLGPRHRATGSGGDFVPQSYNYPSINKTQPISYERAPLHMSTSASPSPARPPKELAQNMSTERQQEGNGIPPKIPQKASLSEYSALIPTTPDKNVYSDAPKLPPKESVEIPVLPKKERLTFKPGAYLENGDPIRSVFLPRGLRASFLEIAAANTRAGVEMCGILCGTPINNALFVRCLLIPDQKCTPDTCETENEATMFDYCDKEDLLVIGWIHTHPTQTCFMSSRDLHTQAGYQIMMPESVAVVCSPKFTPSYGVFRLTNPPGLEHILHCNHTDTFHQHSIGNLYREAEQPHGHVYESDKMPFYVHDLRTK